MFVMMDGVLYCLVSKSDCFICLSFDFKAFLISSFFVKGGAGMT